MPDARWQIQDDGRYLCFQIELGNDYAVTLTIEDGEPGPSVNLWSVGHIIRQLVPLDPAAGRVVRMPPAAALTFGAAVDSAIDCQSIIKASLVPFAEGYHF